MIDDEKVEPEVEMINQNAELRSKLKRYKEEVHRLRERIKVQNEDIEEALDQLTVCF